MKATSAIKELMIKLTNWGILDNLTDNEKRSIESDLKFIATTAIHESSSQIQDLMRDIYKELDK